MDWPEATRYKAVISAQTHRQEIIQDLYTTRDGEPGGMIIYIHTIWWLFLQACNTMKYYPSVTYIVMQKRHHTRFFPCYSGEWSQEWQYFSRFVISDFIKLYYFCFLLRTVVDTHLCHPHEFDFYLCGHAGTKGTSHPMHYHVLFDENNISPDDLQMLTYLLCHTICLLI
ncbi:putative Piwi domain, ribonuclease H-like superfamily [Helianthus anomalus]